MQTTDLNLIEEFNKLEMSRKSPYLSLGMFLQKLKVLPSDLLINIAPPVLQKVTPEASGFKKETIIHLSNNINKGDLFAIHLYIYNQDPSCTMQTVGKLVEQLEKFSNIPEAIVLWNETCPTLEEVKFFTSPFPKYPQESVIRHTTFNTHHFPTLSTRQIVNFLNDRKVPIDSLVILDILKKYFPNISLYVIDGEWYDSDFVEFFPKLPNLYNRLFDVQISYKDRGFECAVYKCKLSMEKMLKHFGKVDTIAIALNDK